MIKRCVWIVEMFDPRGKTDGSGTVSSQEVRDKLNEEMNDQGLSF